MAKTAEKIIAYKGFDKDLKCRDFQYEVGEEYELPKGEKTIVCSNGFHACESPLEVLDYYFLDNNANLSRFCEVELSGEFSKVEYSTKVASSKINIKTEITFAGLIKLGVEWLKEKASLENIDAKLNTHLNDNGNYCAKIASSGKFAKVTSSGDFTNIGSSGSDAQIASLGGCAKIGSSGDYVQIGSSGDYARIASSGENSIIMCAGYKSSAKAKKGSWITLAEWYEDIYGGKLKPKCVKAEYVDGERIKADTWYKLVNGEFVEDDI